MLWQTRPIVLSVSLFALLAAPCAEARAQRPVRPDTILPRSATPGVPTYLREVGPLPEPYTVTDGPYLVMLAAAPSAARMDASRIDGAEPRECVTGKAPAPPSADSAPVALGGTQYLVVIVRAMTVTRNACATRWNVGSAPIWRGVVLRDQARGTTFEPDAAQLEIDGRVQKPALAVRRPLLQLVDGTWRRTGTQLRYYFDMSVLEPRAVGLPQLLLRIWSDSGATSTIELEGAATHRLTFEYFAWSLARAPHEDRPGTLALTPSRPLAPAVRRIVDSARIDLRYAGAQAAAWTASNANRLNPSADAAVMRLVVAEALFAQGSRLLAETVVGDVRSDHRCLSVPAGSSPALASLAPAPTSSPQCIPVSPTRVAAASPVPGLGNLMVHRRVAAFVGASVVGGLMSSALYANAQAKQRYSSYLATGSGPEAESLYGEVSSLRSSARVQASIGLGFWLFDALSAIQSARRHNRMIADDRF